MSSAASRRNSAPGNGASYVGLGSAHRSDQRKNSDFLDQPLGGVIRVVRFVRVVHRLEPQLAPVNAPGLVDLVKRRLDSQAHSLAQCLRWPAENRRLPEKDLMVGDARVSFLAVRRRRGVLHSNATHTRDGNHQRRAECELDKSHNPNAG